MQGLTSISRAIFPGIKKIDHARPAFKFIHFVEHYNEYCSNLKRSETVPVNGSRINFEVYGKGKPLFLLHGFTQSSQSWQPFVEDYAKDFEVYLVDLKGHGKSGSFTEKLSIKAVAEDLAALINYLKIEKISAIGFSYGGDVLFQLALLRPGLVESMISIGACGSWLAKEFPHFVEYLSYKNIANLPWMKEQQTSEEQIRTILDQVINYNVPVSDAEMKTIQSKVLFVLGDQDETVSPGMYCKCKKKSSSILPLDNASYGTCCSPGL